MEELVKEAFLLLYPNKEFQYRTNIIYSGRLKDYGSLVKKRGYSLQFVLNKKWKGIDKEILMGLVQILFLKILKDKKNTINIDLYNNFIRNLHYAVKKETGDISLENSFNRVNEKYFLGLLEKPNLRWGSSSRRTLAHYDYHIDAITVSNLFQDANSELLDYLMYHELLHKKLKFYNRGTRNYHHTGAFKKLERKFENYEEITKELNNFIRNKTRAKRSFWFFDSRI